MCGIVGYAGSRDATPILVEGLKNLEYRGYDSCGIAFASEGKILVTKAKGRLENLVAKLNKGGGRVGIGHTRWATHGKPNEINSHPHSSDSGRFAVVHNGIIENYQEIKKFLSGRGFNFVSQTDSEVIAHLIEYYYSGDMLAAIAKSCNRIHGSYALGIISAYEPNLLYAVRKDSPLVVGIGRDENYIASDIPALLDFTREFIMPDNGEIIRISQRSAEVFNCNKELIQKDIFFADWESYSTQKDGYPHFMLKELYEQPAAIKRTLTSTFDNKELSEILPARLLNDIKKIQIIACGSAYHVGYAGKYFIEKLCRLPVEAEVASEFIYRNPIIDSNTLALVISQSGETADTLSGLRLAKSKGAFTLAIVNAQGSSIAREADYTLLTKAGAEIAVATTKGYITQLAVIYKLGIMLATHLTPAATNADNPTADTNRHLAESKKTAQPDNPTITTNTNNLTADTNINNPTADTNRHPDKSKKAVQSVSSGSKAINTEHSSTDYLNSLQDELAAIPDALKDYLTVPVNPAADTDADNPTIDTNINNLATGTNINNPTADTNRHLAESKKAAQPDNPTITTNTNNLAANTTANNLAADTNINNPTADTNRHPDKSKKAVQSVSSGSKAINTEHSSTDYLNSLQDELAAIPDALKDYLKDISICKQLANNYFSKETCFFLGRNTDYALALEGALKYKEISYIHAQCYPAGELKHGTISLIEKDSLVIACATEEHLLQKMLSNIKEVRTRGAICIVITPFSKIFKDDAEHIIEIPKGTLLAPICAIVSFQLLSYFVASSRGCDIDKPRNLAKSVTVE